MESAATQRVIALVDMDCFYCQVEARLNPELTGKPVAVVQYNQWKGGGNKYKFKDMCSIIAVNYEAKDKGVTRGMRGEEAKRLCPDINLVSVPVLRGKADLSKYRAAGEEVAKIFSDFSDIIQRASIDEAYIDLTKTVKDKINSGVVVEAINLKSTFIVGFSDLESNSEEQRNGGMNEWVKLIKENPSDSPDFHLTVGAIIVEEMREQILAKTGFHCSAGIAHNKILAKLVAGLHKPRHQTILPQDNVPELYDSLPIYKIKSLGGKFGKLVAEKLSVKYMSELYKYSLKELQQKFDEKSGMWLYNIARGIDTEAVTQRLVPGSIGCCKNFPGVKMLRTKHDVQHWVKELAAEISERLHEDLEKNKRRAKLLTVSLYQTVPVSRSDNLHTYETKGIANTALDLLKKFNSAPASSHIWDPPIKFLGLSAGKFSKEQGNIDTFLRNTLRKPELSQVQEASPSTEIETKVGCEPCISTVASTSSDKSISHLEGSGRSSVEKSFFLSFLSNRLVKGISADKNSVFVCSQDKLKNEEAKAVPMPENEVDRKGSATNLASNNGLDTAELVNKTKLCEACDKYINVLDFFEHLDYHAALQLQTEINGEINPRPVNSLNVGIRTSVKDLKNKRKRLEKGKQVNKKVRDIKSFFPVVMK